MKCAANARPMKNCKACLLAVVAFLAAGTFAKPVLNVLKISSSGETALIQKGPTVTTNSFGYVYSVVGSDEELTVENAPSWLKEVKSKQTFRITISANSAGDTNKWFTLNVMTITKNKDNRLGYGYSPTQSIKCLFTRSGAMDGSLKLIYVTPAFNSVRDSAGKIISSGWHINGIACELLDEQGKVISTWGNSTYSPRTRGGIAAFLANPPRTLKTKSMPGESNGGFLKYKSEYVVVQMADK